MLSLNASRALRFGVGSISVDREATFRANTAHIPSQIIMALLTAASQNGSRPPKEKGRGDHGSREGDPNRDPHEGCVIR